MRSSSLYKDLFVFSLFIFSFFYPFGANADFLATSTAECKAYEGTCVKSLICPGETHDGGDCDDWSITDPHNCCFPNVSTSAECTSNGGVCDEKLTVSCPDKQVLLGRCAESKTACCKGSSTGTLPPVSSSYDYTLLEPIPGFEVTDPSPDFPRYLVIIYNFGIWGVGIAAMFMIIVGSFWYLTAAGNNAQLATAKKIIFDALIGLVVAFGAWLILFIINPDLTTINLDSLSTLYVSGPGTDWVSYPLTGPGSGSGDGSCSPVPKGACSIANLKNTCLGSNADVFSSICNVESDGGNSQSESGYDLCKTTDPATGKKDSFSIGLFQINLTVHKIGGLNCPKAFQGKNYNCKVVNRSLYEQCKQAAKDAETNIKKACALSGNGRNVGPWKCTAQKCGFLPGKCRV